MMKEMRQCGKMTRRAEFGRPSTAQKSGQNQFFDELDQKLKEKEQQQRYESREDRYFHAAGQDSLRQSASGNHRTQPAYLTFSPQGDFQKCMRVPRSRLITITSTALNTPQDHPPGYAGYLLPVPGVLTAYPDFRRSGSCRKPRSRRSRLFLLVRYSVPMTMQPTPRCSARWRAWW